MLKWIDLPGRTITTDPTYTSSTVLFFLLARIWENSMLPISFFYALADKGCKKKCAGNWLHFVCLPNRQRTLSKLLTELRCRNVVNNHQLSVQKTCMQRVLYIFQLSFHFAFHRWWLGVEFFVHFFFLFVVVVPLKCGLQKLILHFFAAFF